MWGSFRGRCLWGCLLGFVLHGSGLAGCTLNGQGDGDLGQGDGGPGASGGTVGTSSGVPRGVALVALTSAQASTLCDWTNLTQGGYGRSTLCSSGAVQSTNRSNLDCVNAVSALGGRCPSITVAHVEDCTRATGADLCRFEGAPECVPIATCSN